MFHDYPSNSPSHLMGYDTWSTPVSHVKTKRGLSGEILGKQGPAVRDPTDVTCKVPEKSST